MLDMLVTHFGCYLWRLVYFIGAATPVFVETQGLHGRISWTLTYAPSTVVVAGLSSVYLWKSSVASRWNATHQWSYSTIYKVWQLVRNDWETKTN